MCWCLSNSSNSRQRYFYDYHFEWTGNMRLGLNYKMCNGLRLYFQGDDETNPTDMCACIYGYVHRDDQS